MQQNPNESTKANIVTKVSSLTDEELSQILKMERELFPEGLQDDYDKEVKDDRIAVLAYCPHGKVAGYIFSIPHHEAHVRLKDHDLKMSEVHDAHYIESIAIRKDLQGQGYFSKLMKKFLEVVGDRTITMHARVYNNCSAGMKKHGAEHQHTISNWFGTGEDFDYLVINRHSGL